MLYDYKYLTMAAQNEYPMVGGKVPYCLLNTDRAFIADTALERYLQPISQGERGSKEDSIKEFMSHINLEKVSWKTLAQGGEQGVDKRYGAINLNTSTHCQMINTGIEDLLVGDKIFALPAIPYLSKNNPTVSTFTYKTKLYVHPMLINWAVWSQLAQDLMMIEHSPETARPHTIVGGMIHNVVSMFGNGIEVVDLPKLITYVLMAQPIGKVEFSMEDHRRSVHNFTTTKVSVGGKFMCFNNLFV